MNVHVNIKLLISAPVKSLDVSLHSRQLIWDKLSRAKEATHKGDMKETIHVVAISLTKIKNVVTSMYHRSTKVYSNLLSNMLSEKCVIDTVYLPNF